METDLEFNLIHAFCFSTKDKEGYLIYYEIINTEKVAENTYTGDFYFKYRSFKTSPVEQRLQEYGIETNFIKQQSSDILYLFTNKISFDRIQFKINNIKIISSRIRKKKFSWLRELFNNPMDYKYLRNDILKYFAGIDEPAIFMDLYNKYYQDFPQKNDFLTYKKKFMKREDPGFDSFGRGGSTESIEYQNLSRIFLKGINKVKHLIKSKNLEEATKEIETLDTYYLISQKSKIERQLSEIYELDFEDDEKEEPVGVSEEVIDFMANFQFKMMPKISCEEDTHETLYRINPLPQPPSDEDQSD